MARVRSSIERANRPVTCKDVAYRARVSTHTVSLALRGDPRVKDRTRRIIRAVAKQMNYRPLASARALRAGRTHTVGVIFSALEQHGSAALSAYAAAIESITEALIRQHYHLSLAALAEIKANGDGRRRPRLFEETAVDGALVITKPGPKLAEALEMQSLPYIVFDEGPVPGQTCVCVDEVRAAELAVEHLVALGHKRIVLTPTARGQYRGQEFSQGYVRAMAAAGLPAIPGWDEPSKPSLLPGALEYFESLLNTPNPATALIAYNDHQATKLINWLMKLGYAVPANVSVVALRDVGFTMQMSGPSGLLPMVTCNANMQREMASVAVEKLLHLIKHPNEPVDSVVLQPKLIVRESSGPCRDGQES